MFTAEQLKEIRTLNKQIDNLIDQVVNQCEEALEDFKKLRALEVAGVDNWFGYRAAMKSIEE